MAIDTVTGTWLNSDGLYIKYGTREGEAHRGGQEVRGGPLEVLEFTLDATTLAALATASEKIVSDTAVLPKGAFVQQIDVIVVTATAGTNANLDMGWVDLDRSSNADEDILLDAADAWHEATAGTVTEYVLGTTEAGLGFGAPTATAKLITFGADTAQFTAGELRVRLYYFMP